MPITSAMGLHAPLEDCAANHAALARARGAIAEHRAAFDALAGGALRAGDPLEAAALARMAFTYGMFNDTGLLASPPLERLLNELGRTHVPGDPAVRPTGDPQRVLHVATVVYETGGHGRVLERWLARDRRRPTVLLLKDDEPVPERLRRAAAAADGTLAQLPPGDLFARARALRTLAAGHDLVVLHVSNHEVVVPLAFADPVGRPPTILFNHSSHLLWAGVGCSDVVASFNGYDGALVAQRRGVARERTVLLGLPSSPQPLPSRAEARAALGLDPDAPVLLTVASPYKLAPVVAPAYGDLATAVLDAVPAATLLLAGPTPGDAVVPDHPRVRAFGPVPDLGAHLAAADLLLDSWPITGGTTATDAIAAGLPVIALGDPPLPLVGPRLDELGGAIACARDVPALAALAAELLVDPAARRALAVDGGAALLARSDGDWQAAMEAAIAAARAHAGEGAPPPQTLADVAPGDPECLLELAREHGRKGAAGCTLRDAYVWNVPELPPALRPRTAAEVDERLAQVQAAAPARRRAIAAPAVEREAIERVLDEARALVAAGTVASCALVVPPARVEQAIPLIEAALAAGTDIDVELLTGEDLAAATAAAPGDLVLAAAQASA